MLEWFRPQFPESIGGATIEERRKLRHKNVPLWKRIIFFADTFGY
jgi:hypothetical protein